MKHDPDAHLVHKVSGQKVFTADNASPPREMPSRLEAALKKAEASDVECLADCLKDCCK